jgi:hypothetical protein
MITNKIVNFEFTTRIASVNAAKSEQKARQRKMAVLRHKSSVSPGRPKAVTLC